MFLQNFLHRDGLQDQNVNLPATLISFNMILKVLFMQRNSKIKPRYGETLLADESVVSRKFEFSRQILNRKRRIVAITSMYKRR